MLDENRVEGCDEQIARAITPDRPSAIRGRRRTSLSRRKSYRAIDRRDVTQYHITHTYIYEITS